MGQSTVEEGVPQRNIPQRAEEKESLSLGLRTNAHACEKKLSKARKEEVNNSGSSHRAENSSV